MSVRQAACPHCGTLWQLPTQLAGPVHCSQCRQVFWPAAQTAPAPVASTPPLEIATPTVWNISLWCAVAGGVLLSVGGLVSLIWPSGEGNPRLAPQTATNGTPDDQTTPQTNTASPPVSPQSHPPAAQPPVNSVGETTTHTPSTSETPVAVPLETLLTEFPADPRPPEFPVPRDLLPTDRAEVNLQQQQSVAGQIVEIDNQHHRFWLGLSASLPAATQQALSAYNDRMEKPASALPPGINLPLGASPTMSYYRVDPTLARFARFNNTWWGQPSTLPVDIWESGNWGRLWLNIPGEDRIPHTFCFDEQVAGANLLKTGQVVQLTVAPRVPLWRGVQVLTVEAFQGPSVTVPVSSGGGLELVSPSSADKPLQKISGETVVVGKIIGFDTATSTFSLTSADAYGQLTPGAHYIRIQDWQQLPDFQFDQQTQGREVLAEMQPVELICRPLPAVPHLAYVTHVRRVQERVAAYSRPGFGQQMDDDKVMLGHLLKARRMSRLGQGRETLAALAAGAQFAQETYWGRYLPADINIKPVMEALSNRELNLAWQLAQQTHSIAAALLPAEHWVVVDAQQSLDYVKRLLEATPEERLQLSRSKTLRHQAAQHCHEGQFRPALAALQEAVTIRAKFLGTSHALHAVGLNDVARLQVWLGDWAAAEKSLSECLQLRQRILGQQHPATLASRINLIRLYDVQNQWPKATGLLPETLAGLKALQQDIGQDELPAQVSAEQGALFMNRCRLRPPVAFSDIVDFHIFDRASFPSTFRPAQPVRAAQAFQAGLTGDHPFWLSHFQVHSEGLIGPPDGLPKQFTGLGRGAGFSILTWDQEKAMIDSWVPEENRATAETQVGAVLLNDLTKLRQMLQFSDATVNLQKTAHTLSQQGAKPGLISAELLARQTGARTGHYLTSGPVFEMLSILHPEPFSSRLGYEESVPLSLAGVMPASLAYARVLSAKGAIFSLQQSRRQLQIEPPLDSLLAEMREVTQRMSALAYDIPPPEARTPWRQALGQLAARRELLEAQLGGLEFCQRATTLADVDPELLRQRVPPNAVLVDFVTFLPELPWGDKVQLVEQSIEKLHTTGATDDLRTIAAGYWPNSQAEQRKHLGAAIVRADHPLAWIDLGPLAPIQQHIEAWLLRYSRGPALEPATGPLPEAELRRILWEPLEPALRGASVVLLSPEEHLARFPFAALPGSVPGRYLIEERALAVLPVPQLLPEWFAAPDAEPSTTRMSLLLVGDVDFDAQPRNNSAEPTPNAKRGMFAFGPLPGTADEIKEVEQLYQKTFQEKPNTLRGREATERTLRDAMPAQRVVHLATHGFFAPPDLKAALFEATPVSAGGQAVLVATGQRLCDRQARAVRFHPGLLSGLAAAGINRPRNTNNATLDDGLLTAVEVADIDLRGTELVVLSACQSALGEPADGEGLLGLQRAFQVAGARSVVSSLWEVDDRATQLLMVEFYRNWWQKKLSKLDALRLAQLHMLHHYDPVSGHLRGVGGLRPPPQSSSTPTRLSPFYWAAFQLAGDWR